jgi:hypothetical protein
LNNNASRLNLKIETQGDKNLVLTPPASNLEIAVRTHGYPATHIMRNSSPKELELLMN